MLTRIGARMIVGVALVTALSIGLMAVLIVRTHQADLIAGLIRSADQLSETVKKSTYYDMLENRRESLHRVIETIGSQAGIEKVRIFNKDGQIVFSSDKMEIWRSLDKRAEACYACHAVDRPLEKLPIPARVRIFRGPEGTRVLGIINPIQNEQSCWSAACHAHSRQQTVLGVLDVTVSLAAADRQIAAGRWQILGLAAVAIAATSLLVWWLNRRLVLGPVEALAAGTRRVAEGDLTVSIPVTATHELGDLARAFNEMTRRLAETQRQLTQADKLASVGRLAAGVAHEINNPLTGVLTYASLLLKRAEEGSELKQDLEVIIRETKRCRDIVKGLLDFARATPPKSQPTDLNEVARRAAAVVMNQLALSRVAVALDLTPDLPLISADPNQIQQVLVNLLVNAADAIGEAGGTIRVSTRVVSVAPSANTPIRKATCPTGCDLLDPSVKIGGLPAIRVSRSWDGQTATLHLDPVYGRFNHVASQPSPDGQITVFACPQCRQALTLHGGRCPRCEAPTFGVRTPGWGHVEFCSRTGCHWARWEAIERQGPRPCVEVTVTDTGVGISPEDLPRIFEPFFTTKETRGAGLGLAVTWGIVEGHGGTIDVASEVGKGSRFTVRLPVKPAEAPKSGAI
jgi:two-component system NtrC family sensor kinase